MHILYGDLILLERLLKMIHKNSNAKVIAVMGITISGSQKENLSKEEALGTVFQNTNMYLRNLMIFFCGISLT